MAEWIALDRIACRAVPGRVVGYRDGAALEHACFQQQVVGWRKAFSASPAQDWALYFDDTLDFAAALFGAWHAGKRVFLGGDNLPGTLAGLQQHVQGFVGDVPATFAPLQRASQADPVELPALDLDTLRLVLFTSGSTGTPSAIHKRVAQLTHEVGALQAAFGEELGDARVHGTVAHQHIYGLLFRVLWPLASGRPVMPRTFFPEDLVTALAQHPSILVATPAHLKRLPAQLDWRSLDGQLRAVFSSGGALPEDSAHAARELLGVPATEVLGSSETGGIAWRRWYPLPSSWQPLPGVHWKIEDDCLTVSSLHLDQPGWWRTQDRVEADGQGGFRLLGRADRIVKIEERRVSLEALERELLAHPAVAEVRVLVLPGARVQLAAVVVPSQQGWRQLQAEGRRELSLCLSRHLATTHDAVTRPRRWRFVQTIPINAQGKSPVPMLAALFRPTQPPLRWLRRDEREAELQIELLSDLAAFDGHFPQAAILPGVVQLDWAVAHGREAFAIPPKFLRMELLKFQHVARPGDVLTLSLGWDPARAALSFRYVSAHGTHASGKVLFGDEA